MTPAHPAWRVIDDLDPCRPLDARPVIVPSVAAFDALYWTIGCPLPNGATLFRFYDRKTGLPVGGGMSTAAGDLWSFDPKGGPQIGPTKD